MMKIDWDDSEVGIHVRTDKMELYIICMYFSLIMSA